MSFFFCCLDHIFLVTQMRAPLLQSTASMALIPAKEFPLLHFASDKQQVSENVTIVKALVERAAASEAVKASFGYEDFEAHRTVASHWC